MAMLHQACTLLLIIILQNDFASAEIYFKKGAPHVKLSNNAVLSGTVDFSRNGRPFHSFSGIPYGKIPERFEVAQPAPAWDGIFDATNTAEKMCVQLSFDPDKPGANGEEDCLVLNVFVPMINTQRKGGLPVMLFVHGGGFAVGCGHENGPHLLMDEDAIQVTINYRLGVFGFLSTGDSVVPGNNALKDLVLGLRWIKDNIRNFGGDPGKVTIYGESAGAALVHYLLLSPTTEGLFHRAISQSGTALGPWAYNHNPRALAVKLATYLKCPTSSGDVSSISSQEIVKCLKGVDSGELVAASTSLFPSWPPGSLDNILDFGPVAEPKDSKLPFLTESPWKLMLEESAPLPNKNVPWVVGVTEDEGIFLMSPYLADENLYSELDTKWEDVILRMAVLDRYIDSPEETKIVAGQLRKFYPGEKTLSKESLESLMDLYSDCWFVHGARTAAIATDLI